MLPSDAYVSEIGNSSRAGLQAVGVVGEDSVDVALLVLARHTFHFHSDLLQLTLLLHELDTTAEGGQGEPGVAMERGSAFDSEAFDGLQERFGLNTSW